MQEKSNKMEKIKNIEFLRFIFAIMIVYAHIIYLCVPVYHLYEDFPLYAKLWPPLVDAFLCVEYFFIIAGFFLFFHLKNKQDTTLEFSVNKFVRLWPLLAFSIIVFLLLALFHIGDFYSYGNVINLFLMYSVLIGQKIPVNNGCSWFICSFFWCCLFMHYCYRTFSERIFNILMCILIFFSFTAVLTWSDGQIPGSQTKIWGLFSGALLRGFAGLGLGYFLGMLWKNVSVVVRNFQIKNKIKSVAFFIVVSAIEIYLFVFLINNSIFHRISFHNDFIFIIVFSCLFLLFLARKGLLSKLLENNISVFLGKFSFAIYIMQDVGFAIEKHFMWTNKAFVYAHPYWNIWASILICVVIGVLSHIFVEQKAVKAFNAIKVKIRSASELSGGGGNPWMPMPPALLSRYLFV